MFSGNSIVSFSFIVWRLLQPHISSSTIPPSPAHPIILSSSPEYSHPLKLIKIIHSLCLFMFPTKPHTYVFDECVCWWVKSETFNAYLCVDWEKLLSPDSSFLALISQVNIIRLIIQIYCRLLSTGCLQQSLSICICFRAATNSYFQDWFVFFALIN